MPPANPIVAPLWALADSVVVACLVAVATIVLFHQRLSHLRERRVPAKLPTHLVLIAASRPHHVAHALLHLRDLGVPFVTVVGLTLDVLAPYLPGLSHLPDTLGETPVEFSWRGAQLQTPPVTSRFRWMRAEDGRVRLANKLKNLIINNENIMSMLSDSWPLPCLALVESATTCLNGTDTLPIRQADLHFVSALNVRSIVKCLCAFARGEQRFGK